MSRTSTDTDLHDLFSRYLCVVNQAINQNRYRFPYKQIVAGGERLLGQKTLGVAIYKSDPDVPYDYFTLTYRHGAFQIIDHGTQQPDIEWKLSDQHIAQVVGDPDLYIEQPIKLDLAWVKTRLGLE